MLRGSIGLVLSALSLLAIPAEAQRRPGMGAGGGPGGPGAEFFLARTGELRLTDAQVVRLAAIARRTADRRRAMRASVDSLVERRPAVRGDSVARAARMREAEQMRARLDRERDQAHGDLRDALAVLTPDQQAMAWEMVGRGGPGARGARFRPGRESRDRARRPARRPDGGSGADRQRAPHGQRFRM